MHLKTAYVGGRDIAGYKIWVGLGSIAVNGHSGDVIEGIFFVCREGDAIKLPAGADGAEAVFCMVQRRPRFWYMYPGFFSSAEVMRV